MALVIKKPPEKKIVKMIAQKNLFVKDAIEFLQTARLVSNYLN